MKQKSYWMSLVFFVLLGGLIGALGSYWTAQSVMTWYPLLNKPSWTPPSYVFGPVWSMLYLMIAVSGSLIYNGYSSPKRYMALRLFVAQLFLNCLWSFLFFYMRSPFLAFIDISVLSILLVFTILYASKVNRLAGFILLPYLAWVVYAATLNGGVWLMNESCRNKVICNTAAF